jgi:phosphatidate cytidylyltransferase
MGKRLLLGPIMILLLIGALALDEWLDARAMPEGVRGVLASAINYREGTFPPGVVAVPMLAMLVSIAARELSSLLEAENIEGSKRMLTSAAIAGLLVSCLVPAALPATTVVGIFGTVSVLVLAVAMTFYSRHKTVEGVIAATGGVLLSYVYLGIMAGFLLALRREHSVFVIGWIILTTKACDIGAYFTGRAIGRTKLIPWLSPGKTWEGLAGGVALSAAIGALGMRWIGSLEGLAVPDWYHGALLGAVLGIAGQAGDLLESILKRDAGKKDSGRGIPGFGGLLDVLDSILLASPVAFWWLHVMSGKGYFAPLGG